MTTAGLKVRFPPPIEKTLTFHLRQKPTPPHRKPTVSAKKLKKKNQFFIQNFSSEKLFFPTKDRHFSFKKQNKTHFVKNPIFCQKQFDG